MRLINTRTLELHTFFDTQVPPYAILSHTWGDDEVDLQTFVGCEARERRGWKKIDECCQLAVAQAYEWVWIDTCCIDKNSSAELSEAINSMYRWYQQAEVCYAFLEDLRLATQTMNRISTCRWFTRGWTLQELLAPKKVEFYDASLEFIGTRESLAWELSKATKISVGYLTSTPIDHACIAERMSWAAARQTTRIEDQAYCLLGIFDVNMALLYGEREKAFLRLQQAIIAQSNDESIFAWTMTQPVRQYGTAADARVGGMLAKSAKEFAHSGSVRRIFTPPIRPPSLSTNLGIELAVTLYSSRALLADYFTPSPAIRLEVPLACEVLGGAPSERRRLTVHLVRHSDSEWLWHREASPTHLTTKSHILFFHMLEAVIAGYSKIFTAEATDRYTLRRQAKSSLWNRRLSTLLNAVLVLQGPVVVYVAIVFTNEYGDGKHTPMLAILHWIALAWYWRLHKQNLWSLALLPLPVLFTGLKSTLVLAGFLCIMSALHVGEMYRSR